MKEAFKIRTTLNIHLRLTGSLVPDQAQIRDLPLIKTRYIIHTAHEDVRMAGLESTTDPLVPKPETRLPDIPSQTIDERDYTEPQYQVNTPSEPAPASMFLYPPYLCNFKLMLLII